MSFFTAFVGIVAGLPDLLAFVLCPALAAVAALLLAIFRAGKAYPPVAIGLGGVAAFLMYCNFEDPWLIVPYLGLYIALCALLGLLFLIPFGKREKKNRDEELYEKFRSPIEEGEPEEEPEDGALYDAGDCGMRLRHASELLEALGKCELEAGDRLEADSLSRSLDAYRDRELTADEMRALNDCLATLLKLTAKYKL